MRALFVAVVLTAAACGAPPSAVEAPQAEPVGIVIADAWARPSPGGVNVAAGYLTIRSEGRADDALLSATSPRAAQVELHEMTMEGGVMRMRPVASLALPAGGQVELAPEGRHLMFIGVATPFAIGEQIPVTLAFAHAGQIEIVLDVRTGATHGHP